jgi:hypothetical protein
MSWYAACGSILDGLNWFDGEHNVHMGTSRANVAPPHAHGEVTVLFHHRIPTTSVGRVHAWHAQASHPDESPSLCKDSQSLKETWPL